MANVLVEEQSLINIANALRGHIGETHIEMIPGYAPLKQIVKTSNATGFDSRVGGYGDNQSIINTITIPGASKIRVDFSYQTENTTYDWLQWREGVHTTNGAFNNLTKYGGSTLQRTQLTFNGESVSYFFRADGSSSDYLGFYAEVVGLDASGQPMVSTELVDIPTEVPTVFKPAEMGSAITDLAVLPINKITPFRQTELVSKFAYNAWNWVANDLGQYIPTEGISSLDGLCMDSNLLTAFNITINGDSATVGSMRSAFYGCSAIEYIAPLNDLCPDTVGSMFQNCYRLRALPEMNNWNWNVFESYSGSAGCAFVNCQSLRVIPTEFVSKLYPTADQWNTIYYCGFQNCYVLDELIGLPVTDPWTEVTGNLFDSTFQNCYRLKDIIFDMEDGVYPRTVQWANQVIDLSYNIGYVNNADYILGTNSGLTTATKMASNNYASLKDNPDNWTTDFLISRYDKASAIRTINSLPDASQYLTDSGNSANIIKFKKRQGQNGNNGSISDLTQEQIAVATAKGWTVSLVD